MRAAGAAEAGWRATIAAIEVITLAHGLDLSPCNGGSCMVATDADSALDLIKARAEQIIAAWPEEML